MKLSIKTNSYQPDARKAFVIQGVFGTAFTVLTSGVLLSGFAIFLGASDLLVSYISMVVNICGASILFFSALLERFRSFKRTTIGFTICSKLVTLLIVLIPAIVPKKGWIMVFIPLIIVAFTLQAQTTVVLNNWMVNFVEEKQSGRYIAHRQTFVLVVTVILSVAGGRLLDGVEGAYVGFFILFLIAFLMGILEVATLLQIPDVEKKVTIVGEKRYRDIFLVPMKNKPFLRFVVYIALFYLTLTLADSFTVVYMMRYLELPYTTTTLMQMLISFPQIFLLGIWGRIGDKKGHQFALKASIWFFIGETLFMGFSNPQNLYVFIPMAFLFASVANAGFIVSVFNRRYELMPAEGRILYDNFYTAAIGIAFVLGPVIGGGVKLWLESSHWVEEVIQFGNIRILYGVSTVAIIVLQVVFHLQGKYAAIPETRSEQKEGGN